MVVVVDKWQLGGASVWSIPSLPAMSSIKFTACEPSVP
jgi:hypothetical protein